MSNGLLSVATSGLMAMQRSMATVSHNIANVNTEGYSRQRTELVAAQPQYVGAPGYLGTGVDIEAITRSHDQFVTEQLRASTSAYGQLDAYHQMISQIDNFIADPDASLSPALQGFFNAIHGVANEPTSIPVRRVMLTSAETLVNRFHSINKTFDDLRDQANASLATSIDEVNALASNLADMNERITSALGTSRGTPPNDLLDQRDKLLADLAQQVDIRVLAQDDGSVNVFIGSGQSLVMANRAGRLQIMDSEFGSAAQEIALYTPGATTYTVVTDKLSGGHIGGYTNFTEQVLNPVQNDFGRIAASLASQFNTQHRAGYDLNGNTNIAFFNEPQITVIGKSGNTLSAIPTSFATYADFNALSGADYQIDVTASGARITNLRTQAVTSYGAMSFVHEGIQFDLTGAASGDSFLIQPTRHAAGDIALALTEPSSIAAAQGITTNPPPGGPALGDNRNALALANLQNAKNLSNGRSTYQDAYHEIVGAVGTFAKTAEINATAQKSMLDHVRQRRDSISGVNLDEEAAKLIQFQQAYQASAQTIATARSLFETLLSAVR